MLNFDSEKHLYTWNGSPVPSVTQVIGTWTKIVVGGIKYYYNSYTGDVVKPHIIEQAGDWGDAVHKVAEIILSGGDLDEEITPPELVAIGECVKKWRREYKPDMIALETPSYSIRYRYAGTPDIVCRIGGIEGIVDIKSGGSETVGIQTAAYCHLVFGKYAKRWLMQASKPREPASLKFEVIKSNFDCDWNMYLSLLNIYTYKSAA